jgi:hypothetical protein
MRDDCANSTPSNSICWCCMRWLSQGYRYITRYLIVYIYDVFHFLDIRRQHRRVLFDFSTWFSLYISENSSILSCWRMTRRWTMSHPTINRDIIILFYLIDVTCCAHTPLYVCVYSVSINKIFDWIYKYPAKFQVSYKNSVLCIFCNKWRHIW